MTEYVRLTEQPGTTDLKLVDGIFVKATTFPHAGMVAPQHAHEYAHLSAIVSGRVRVEADGVSAEHAAPALVTIPARVKHLFHIMEPGTVIWCIHNADRAAPGEVAIHEHYEIVGA